MTYPSLFIIIEEPVGFASSIHHKYNSEKKKNVYRNRKTLADVVIWRRYGFLFLLETLYGTGSPAENTAGNC